MTNYKSQINSWGLIPNFQNSPELGDSWDLIPGVWRLFVFSVLFFGSYFLMWI